MKTLLTMFCIFFTGTLLRSQTIKQAEYFIDKDQGVGKNTKLNLTASADSSYQLNIDVSGVSEGFHKLYIRVKDSKGKWSLPVRKTIQVTNTFNQAQITKGEYFFDKDPGYGKGKPITVSSPDTIIEKNFAAITSALGIGHHKLYIRCKDDNGNWGITSHRNIEIIKTQDTVKIVAAEYFFTSDKGYNHATRKVFSDSLADGKFKFKIPYNKIPANADTLFIRTEDSLGNWSLTGLAKFSVQSFTNASTTLENDNSIVNNVETFTVFPNPASHNINVDFKSKNANASLQIFDMNGKIILEKIIISSAINTIDISKLIAGSYTITINDGQTQRTEKFIKQ
ncbi:MAG: T9SS type A sorting domain-containing protein [Parafilimonas sp.]|nr:T9SS type A sorting domain-containing protein [Parafilimonas sp.]